MSPSADGMVHKHSLPYETELGSSVTLDRLLLYVSQMNQRPSIPEQWERETQVGDTVHVSVTSVVVKEIRNVIYTCAVHVQHVFI